MHSNALVSKRLASVSVLHEKNMQVGVISTGAHLEIFEPEGGTDFQTGADIGIFGGGCRDGAWVFLQPPVNAKNIANILENFHQNRTFS